ERQQRIGKQRPDRLGLFDDARQVLPGQLPQFRLFQRVQHSLAPAVGAQVHDAGARRGRDTDHVKVAGQVAQRQRTVRQDLRGAPRGGSRGGGGGGARRAPAPPTNFAPRLGPPTLFTPTAGKAARVWSSQQMPRRTWLWSASIRPAVWWVAETPPASQCRSRF